MQDGKGFSYGHLKLRHLYLLHLLARERSITRAAQILHLSQPAVSAMLRELEAHFGMRMVERSAQGVRLTPAAEAALRRFSIALAEVDAGREEAFRAQQQARLRLRVGTLTVAMLELIPNAMSQLVRESPGIQVEITEGTVDGLSEALMRGEVDCVVGRLAAPWAKTAEEVQIEQLKLYDEPRCLVCRTGHPLANRPQLDLATLAAHPWVLQPVPSSTRLLFDEMFISNGLSPPAPTVESHSAHSNMDIVATTQLLGIAPLALARRHIATKRLHMLRAPVALAGMSISLIWRRASRDDPLLARLRHALIAVSPASDPEAGSGC